MSKQKMIAWLAVLLLLVVWVQSIHAANVSGKDTSGYLQNDAVQILLDGNSIAVEGDGVLVDGSTATIVSAGLYSISGSLTDGQIIVNTEDETAVQLILNGATINSSTSAPLYIENAEEAVLILQDNNYVSDGSSYVFASADVDEPNAAIFSKSDLTISGDGSLTVNGNYNDGIASKGGLVIDSGTITVNAVDDGIRGKDYLVINAGTITVNAQGDGLKSDNADDATLGYITVQSGVLRVNAGGDALSAETNVLITDGVFTLSAGGIKAVVGIQIDGGSFTIDTADDALHSNGSVIVNGGSYVISSGDDGIHADATLDVNGGNINIITSYEGIESAIITVNAGTIHIVASDDGVNVASGNDVSGMMQARLSINGGYMVVDAAGDGIDANGAIVMTDGFVIVNGPTENMNSALDYDAGFNLTGGFIVAAGSAGMAMAPDQSSTQASLLLNLDAVQSAGTLISLQSSDGNEIVTFAPTKAYQSIVISSPELILGSTLNVYLGGSSSGTVQDSLYQDGSYSPGTQYTSVTLSGIVTQVGQGGGFGGGRRP
jgi:hypothetical protein